jgi:hypothetical protein
LLGEAVSPFDANFIVLKEHAESVRLAAATFPDTPLIVSRHAYGDPSRDGTRVLFASEWGGTGIYAYVAQH